MVFLEKKNIGIILLILVIVIGIVIFSIPLLTSPTPSISLTTKLNESGIPQGTITHLSEKDFEEFPMLAPVIRDNTKHGIVYANGTKIEYIVMLSLEDKERFIERYPKASGNHTTGESETYFEYKGKYYSYTPPTAS